MLKPMHRIRVKLYALMYKIRVKHDNMQLHIKCYKMHKLYVFAPLNQHK